MAPVIPIKIVVGWIIGLNGENHGEEVGMDIVEGSMSIQEDLIIEDPQIETTLEEGIIIMNQRTIGTAALTAPLHMITVEIEKQRGIVVLFQ
jgi:hypothetical protein